MSRYRGPLYDQIVELYRRWASGHQGVWNKKEAWGDLSQQIINLIRDGHEPIDEENLAQLLFDLADEAITDDGERDSAEMVEGQEEMPGLELPYPLKAIIALGRGDRCAFEDMRIAEWHRHDDLKHGNVKAVQDKYNLWRLRSDKLMPGLLDGLSVREIYNGWGRN